MNSSEPRNTRANYYRSRSNVARISNGGQVTETRDCAAGNYTAERAVARQRRGTGKSHREPFLTHVVIATLALLLVFFSSEEICHATSLFSSIQLNAGSVTASQLDKDKIVGIVGHVGDADDKTAPAAVQTGEPVDGAALKSWQNSDSAPKNSLKEDNHPHPKAVTAKDLPVVQGYEQALPGFTFEFPRDHSSHNQYRTEWWYYSGHFKSTAGKTYGYELTFFRLGGDYEPNNPNSAWKGENYNLAHFTITDECGKKFFVDEKTSHSRAGAKASTSKCHVQNQGWSVCMQGDNFVLDAKSDEFSIHLLLDSKKPPIIHGVDGFCQKSQRTGEGTHYYSMTRLKTDGTLFIGNKPVAVTGLSWMDHEFGSYRLTPEQCGWNWYSIQLDDDRELMICLIRRLDGTLEPASCGTIIDARGNSRHLYLDQFEVINTDTWHSEKSGGTYPMGWHVSVPGEALELNISTRVLNQELNTAAPVGITYWEGAVQLEGYSYGKHVTGQGYAEMTGYCEANKQSIF